MYPAYSLHKELEQRLSEKNFKDLNDTLSFIREYMHKRLLFSESPELQVFMRSFDAAPTTFPVFQRILELTVSGILTVSVFCTMPCPFQQRCPIVTRCLLSYPRGGPLVGWCPLSYHERLYRYS